MRLSPVLLASTFLLARAAAADVPAPETPTLWTRWARTIPVLPLETCEVELESDLSFVRFLLSVRF